VTEDGDESRGPTAGLARWLALTGDRTVVTGLLVAGVFLALVGAGLLVPGATAAALAGDSVDTLFGALVGATVTGVTLVLTLTQLVVSQELGAVGDQRERMAAATDFREEVADAVEMGVGPARPAAFLRVLVEATVDGAERLGESADRLDGEARAELEAFATDLTERGDRAATALAGGRFGEFEVVGAALAFEYARWLFAARRVRAHHGDALDEAGASALEDVVERLELFGAAREHVKTLYFQWDLIGLSRRLLVAAVPALVVAVGMVLLFDPATPTGGDPLAVVVVAGAVTVSLVPFLLLLAHVARIATVTRDTLSIGPFVLRPGEDLREVDRD
jgi:hypothetical protein